MTKFQAFKFEINRIILKTPLKITKKNPKKYKNAPTFFALKKLKIPLKNSKMPQRFFLLKNTITPTKYKDRTFWFWCSDFVFFRGENRWGIFEFFTGIFVFFREKKVREFDQREVHAPKTRNSKTRK